MTEYTNYNLVYPNDKYPSVYFVKDIEVKEDLKKCKP